MQESDMGRQKEQPPTRGKCGRKSTPKAERKQQDLTQYDAGTKPRDSQDTGTKVHNHLIKIIANSWPDCFDRRL